MRYDAPASREDREKSVPAELDRIADVCLHFRPKRKQKKLLAKKRRKAR
jgi:hypothetical protein